MTTAPCTCRVPPDPPRGWFLEIVASDGSAPSQRGTTSRFIARKNKTTLQRATLPRQLSPWSSTPLMCRVTPRSCILLLWCWNLIIGHGLHFSVHRPAFACQRAYQMLQGLRSVVEVVATEWPCSCCHLLVERPLTTVRALPQPHSKAAHHGFHHSQCPSNIRPHCRPIIHLDLNAKRSSHVARNGSLHVLQDANDDTTGCDCDWTTKDAQHDL